MEKNRRGKQALLPGGGVLVCAAVVEVMSGPSPEQCGISLLEGGAKYKLAAITMMESGKSLRFDSADELRVWEELFQSGDAVETRRFTPLGAHALLQFDFENGAQWEVWAVLRPEFLPLVVLSANPTEGVFPTHEIDLTRIEDQRVIRRWTSFYDELMAERYR